MDFAGTYELIKSYLSDKLYNNDIHISNIIFSYLNTIIDYNEGEWIEKKEYIMFCDDCKKLDTYLYSSYAKHSDGWDEYVCKKCRNNKKKCSCGRFCIFERKCDVCKNYMCYLCYYPSNTEPGLIDLTCIICHGNYDYCFDSSCYDRTINDGCGGEDGICHICVKTSKLNKWQDIATGFNIDIKKLNVNKTRKINKTKKELISEIKEKISD